MESKNMSNKEAANILYDEMIHQTDNLLTTAYEKALEALKPHWQVMWIDEVNGRKSIAVMQGFISKEEAEGYIRDHTFAKEEYATVEKYMS